jgi:hypothetical protein
MNLQTHNHTNASSIEKAPTLNGLSNFLISATPTERDEGETQDAISDMIYIETNHTFSKSNVTTRAPSPLAPLAETLPLHNAVDGKDKEETRELEKKLKDFGLAPDNYRIFNMKDEDLIQHSNKFNREKSALLERRGHPIDLRIHNPNNHRSFTNQVALLKPHHAFVPAATSPIKPFPVSNVQVNYSRAASPVINLEYNGDPVHQQYSNDYNAYFNQGVTQSIEVGHNLESNYNHSESNNTQINYEQSNYEQSGYEQSSYEQSGYEQSNYEQSGYEQSSYEQSNYEQSSYEQSSYEQSNYEQSNYNNYTHNTLNNSYNYADNSYTYSDNINYSDYKATNNTQNGYNYADNSYNYTQNSYNTDNRYNYPDNRYNTSNYNYSYNNQSNYAYNSSYDQQDQRMYNSYNQYQSQPRQSAPPKPSFDYSSYKQNRKRATYSNGITQGPLLPQVPQFQEVSRVPETNPQSIVAQELLKKTQKPMRVQPIPESKTYEENDTELVEDWMLHNFRAPRFGINDV